MAPISAIPDQDWYLVANRPFSSYQMVVEGMTGDLDFVPPSVQRMSSAGNVVLEDATVLEGGGALSLQWPTVATVVNNFVRVRNAACGTACTDFSSYRIRFYDSTYTVPRFNNSGSQTTVLLIQNATDRTCTLTTTFFDASGAASVMASPVTLPPRGLQVLPTATLVGGQSGSVRVTHTCGYGGLSGKAVALEPATGFTFDTPLVARPD